MARKRKPPGSQGDPRTYDADFHGPTANRSCTDVLCCMVFMLFIMGYILLGLMAWSQGDPRRVAYPTDSQGHFCGQKGTPNENKPVLFYFNLFKCTSSSVMLRLECPTTQDVCDLFSLAPIGGTYSIHIDNDFDLLIKHMNMLDGVGVAIHSASAICVSRCPEKFQTYMEMQYLNQKDQKQWEYYRQFCKATASHEKSFSDLLFSGECPPAVYPSRPFLQRCMPDFSTVNGTLTVGNQINFEDESGRVRSIVELRDAAHGINKILDTRTVGMKLFEDYTTAWKWILIALTLAMLLSWTFLILLRFTAGFLFWFFMFGVLGIIGYGIWYCFMEYDTLQRKPPTAIMIYKIGIQTTIGLFFYLKQTWFSMMIILSIIEATIILVLIFLRRRIQVALIMLKEGSKAISYIPSTLIYPVLTFILLSICISYWAVTAIFLATSGVPVFKVMIQKKGCMYEDEICDPEIFPKTSIPKECPGASCNFASYGGRGTYDDYMMAFHFYNLFALLWLTNFVIALGQCTLAGAFASYYWAMKKPDDIPQYPVFTAFGRAVRYHTGSLAFGSLILASIQMFKVIMEYLDTRLKKAHNRVAKFLQCCLRCCFWCLEKMVKFLNRNAYIMIALYGRNFCDSTRDAFYLLMRNILKVAVTDEVTHFVLLMGKILVSAIVGILSFLLFTARLERIVEGPTTLHYYWLPFLIVILGSYLIAHGFFSVYSMCVETIFICFLEDLERNEGSPSRPYFVNPTLMYLLLDQKRFKKRWTATGHFTTSMSSPSEEYLV